MTTLGALNFLPPSRALRWLREAGPRHRDTADAASGPAPAAWTSMAGLAEGVSCVARGAQRAGAGHHQGDLGALALGGAHGRRAAAAGHPAVHGFGQALAVGRHRPGVEAPAAVPHDQRYLRG